MTDAERDRLAAYFRILADRMALKDWAIEVLDEPADDNAHAEIRCVEGRKLAKIRFAHDWRDRTPEQMRHNCVHELIHCHFATLWYDMGRRLRSVDGESFIMLLEYGIDGVADGWAAGLPTMPEFEGGDEIMGRQKAVKATKAPAGPAQPKPQGNKAGKTPTAAAPKPRAGKAPNGA